MVFMSSNRTFLQQQYRYFLQAKGNPSTPQLGMRHPQWAASSSATRNVAA
jgi:hypothetical protein